MKFSSDDFDDSRARRLFPGEDDSYVRFGNYQPIVDSFGEVLVQVDDDDYQGDTRVLLRNGGRFGFLNFGWGSCSGCDALQACNSYRDVEELIRGLESDIKWFASLDEAKEYILSQQRAEQYYYHSNEWSKFVELVRECQS